MFLNELEIRRGKFDTLKEKTHGEKTRANKKNKLTHGVSKGKHQDANENKTK